MNKTSVSAVAAATIGVSMVFFGATTTTVPTGIAGIAEFKAGSCATTCTWTAPTGINHVEVEAWGGGGGGGGNYAGDIFCANFDQEGGSGGGGGYVRTSIAVTAGHKYTVLVGVGGVGGSPSQAGGAGGRSGIAPNAVANGGGGGGAGVASGVSAGGVGGSAIGTVIRVGGTGESGSGGCSIPGGVGFAGSMEWDNSGGKNGDGTTNVGGAGDAGYVLLTW